MSTEILSLIVAALAVVVGPTDDYVDVMDANRRLWLRVWLITCR